MVLEERAEMGGQLKRHSFEESLINVAVGFAIALVSQLIIFPLYDIHVPFISNLKITLWFTAVSIVRSYFLRRFYNYRMLRWYSRKLDAQKS